MPGTIAGGIGFAIILAAFLMATDKSRQRTSESALTFVAFVDVASIFVHYPVFSGYDVANWITTVCICGHSKEDRQYTALDSIRSFFGLHVQQ
jgi:hypothetical protein